ncbi:MAG: hypothetical protein RLZ89_1048, partial [Pseudomonadota bacterium]
MFKKGEKTKELPSVRLVIPRTGIFAIMA